jgi:hypothetical protein
VAVQQSPDAEIDPEPRWEAYRLASELLTGFRKIVERALVKAVGADWSSSACPGSVADRIATRRIAELEVERFAPVDEDAMSYTTFLDLAELAEANPTVAGMLGGLSSSPDGFVADLRTLEDIRVKIAAARPLTDAETVVLAERHLRLKEKLASVRHRRTHPDPEAPEDRPASPAATQPQPAGVDSPGDAVTGDESPPIAAPADDEPASSEAPAGDISSEIAGAVARGSARSRAEQIFDGASTPVGLVDVDSRDLEVLRELRLEIIAAAEAAYNYSEEIETTVWERELESGWFGDKLEAYGLGDLATFYAVLEGYLERRRRGSNREGLRTFLADRELAKLLLRLRELFIRLRV